jgi:hypothetical protein
MPGCSPAQFLPHPCLLGSLRLLCAFPLPTFPATSPRCETRHFNFTAKAASPRTPNRRHQILLHSSNYPSRQPLKDFEPICLRYEVVTCFDPISMQTDPLHSTSQLHTFALSNR